MKIKTTCSKFRRRKKVWRRRGAIWLALTVLLSGADVSVFSDIQAQAAENEQRIVYFGNYIQREVTDEAELEELRFCDQEGLFTGGNFFYQDTHYRKKDHTYYKDAPIAWRVLKDDGDYLTLLSDKVLESRAYDSGGSWKDSAIRKWLNEDFFEDAFTQEEQEQIAWTKLSTERLVYMKPSVIEVTEDKIYLPHEEDVRNADYGFSISDSEDESRTAYQTEYLDKKESASSWWLRGDPNWSYGNPQNVRVTESGSFARWYMTWGYGIRPMLRVKKDAAGLLATEPEEKKLNTEYQDSSFDLTRKVAQLFEGESGYGQFTVDGPEVKAAGLEFNLFKFNCEVSAPFKFDHTDFCIKYDASAKTAQVLVGYNDKAKKELDKSKKDSNKWKNDWERTKSLVLKNQNLPEISYENDQAETLKEKFDKALKDAKERKASVLFKAEAKILGYFELQFDDSGQYITSMNEGGIFFEGTIGVNARQYLLGSILYAQEGVTGGAEISLAGKWDAQNKKIKPHGSFSLIVEPSIALGANALVADVQGGVKGELKGTVEVSQENKNASTGVKVWLKGSAFVALSAIIGVKVEKSWKFPKYVEIWPNLSIQDEPDMQMRFAPAEPLGADQAQLLQKNGENQIGSNVMDSLAYEHAKPQTAELPDGRILLTYLSDSQKSAKGQNTLMYRVYANGGWSKATAVFQTSRMDTAGRLFQYEGNTYVIYENSEVLLDESMSSEEVAASMEIYVAKFDAAAGEFQKPVKVSEANDTYKHGYLLCEKDGRLTAMWAENSEKDVMQQNGTTKIYASSLADGAWSEAQEYQSIDKAIQHMGFAKGKLMYSIGNEFWLGGKWYAPSETIDSQNFQYANDKIYYAGDRGLCYVSQEGGSGQRTGVYTSNTYALDGERGVYWTQAVGYKSNIWYQSFEKGSYPVQITREDGYIGGFAVCQNEGENVLVYTLQTVDENAQDPYGKTVLKSTSDLSRTEARIDSVSYDAWSYQAGGANEFTVEATNSGTTDLHNVEAAWSDERGNEIARTLLYKKLPAGGRASETVEIEIPAEMKQGKLIVTLEADEALESEASYERSIEACEADLSISPAGLTQVKVKNAGDGKASNVKICVYDGNRKDVLLKTYKVGDLNAGALKTVDVSDAYRNAKTDEETGQKSLYCVVLQEAEEYAFSDNVLILRAEEGKLQKPNPGKPGPSKPSSGKPKPSKPSMGKPVIKKPDSGNAPAKKTFASGATVETKFGRYQVISAKKKTARLISVKKKKATKLVVPATVKICGITCKVTEVGANVMKGNDRLTKAALGKHVVTIGKRAFYGCKKLKTVEAKGKLKAIKSGAFKNTSKKLCIWAKKLTKKQKRELLRKLRKSGNKKGTVK